MPKRNENRACAPLLARGIDRNPEFVNAQVPTDGEKESFLFGQWQKGGSQWVLLGGSWTE